MSSLPERGTYPSLVVVGQDDIMTSPAALTALATSTMGNCAAEET
jgi:hypothetical protein